MLTKPNRPELRSAEQRTPSAKIIATGQAIPEAMVHSEYLDSQIGKPNGWLQKQTGIDSRSIASEEETQEKLAVIAAQRALDDAGMAPDEVDLVLFGAAVGRQPIPATAPLVKSGLGISSPAVPAFDVNATCLSALAALDIASLQIGAGRARTVLVVASEISSRALPWQTDPRTAALFGDGAGAMLVQAPDSVIPGLMLKHFAMETYAEGYEFCTLASGGTGIDYHADAEKFVKHAFFCMNGHALFKLTRKRLPAFIEKLVHDTGWQMKDIDVVIPHQASPLALEHMVRRCGFASEKIINTVRETGNLVAASLPITLDTARTKRRIQPGAKVLMIGTSAGVSFAGATLEA